MKSYSVISAVFLLLVKEYQMLLKRYDTTELPKVSAAYSTELLLTHLTETWRTALDSGKAVAVAFIDFKKALKM